jgi:TolB-like protein/Tfp pilus assembly protein PilF
MSLYQELKRRNVIRVATAYVVAAWLVIQVIETIFPAFGYTDRAVRITVIVLGIGFIPAIIGAWVFELTPEGLKRDDEVRGAVTSVGAKVLDRAIILLLVLGISYFAFDKFVLAPERIAEAEAEAAAQARVDLTTGFYGDRSIAVIPFDNLSDDPGQQLLADGIAEEVLNLLAGIRKLRVISRTSAFALRDENLEIPEIAERLDVAHILEGSVRKSGNRVRVTAQLIEARSDTHLWSNTYTHELGDDFRIQDEIAGDVVANLQVELLSALPRTRHVDPEVLSLTAQAYQLHQARPAGTGEKMYALMSRALEIDPEHIPALDMMAMAHWYLIGERYASFEEGQAMVRATLLRILEIDPDSAYVEFYDAFMLSGENKLEEAAALYSTALGKDVTRPDNVRIAGYFAQQIGKLETASKIQRYALAIDPLCHQCRRRYAESLMYAGDYTTAQREYERYLTAGSSGWQDYVLLLLLQGKAEEALEYLESTDDLVSSDSDDDSVQLLGETRRAMALYSLGRADEAEQIFEELSRSDYHDQRALTLFLTEIAAWMGDKDFAFEKLFEMAATGFQFLHRRTFSPIWQNLHDDPRWIEYREFNGTSPERLYAIEFDPPLPE